MAPTTLCPLDTGLSHAVHNPQKQAPEEVTKLSPARIRHREQMPQLVIDLFRVYHGGFDLLS